MVAVVVVTGGVSGIVVCGAVPSWPVDGSGAGCPIPCCEGVWVLLCGALVMSGGAFW